MIRQSRDIIYIEDHGSVYDFLPAEPKSHTNPDHKEWLLSRTRKRLKKMGVETELKRRDVFTINAHRIDSGRLSRLILDMNYHTQRLFMEPHCLLMGHRQLEDLIGEQINSESGYGAFHGPLELCCDDRRIYGIDIKVVPGLDTLVLIPKSIL